MGYSALMGGLLIVSLTPLQYKLASIYSNLQKRMLVSIEIFNLYDL